MWLWEVPPLFHLLVSPHLFISSAVDVRGSENKTILICLFLYTSLQRLSLKSSFPPHFFLAGNRELLGEMEGIDVLLQQLSVRRWTRPLHSVPDLTKPLAPIWTHLTSTGVQTSQPVHGRGAGDDGEPLWRLVLLPHAASQSGTLPQRGGASADESDAQVRIRGVVVRSAVSRS